MPSPLTVAALESALTKDFRRYHLAAQATRLLGGSLSTFLIELAAGGPHDWTTKALIAAAVGAVWTTARRQWPTLPWSLVAGHLAAARASEQAAGAAARSVSPSKDAPGDVAPDNAGANAATSSPSA